MITGTQYRYLNTFPILLNVCKHFGTYGSLGPYVGINAGMYIIENRLEVGLYSLQETNVHVGAAPEVGVKLPTGKFLGFRGARHHFTTEAGNTPALGHLWGTNPERGVDRTRDGGEGRTATAPTVISPPPCVIMDSEKSF